ncbi:hypothetical protein NOMA109596_06745 [Nocardioides marinus]
MSLPAPPSASAFQFPEPNSALMLELALVELTAYTLPVLCCMA